MSLAKLNFFVLCLSLVFTAIAAHAQEARPRYPRRELERLVKILTVRLDIPFAKEQIGSSKRIAQQELNAGANPSPDSLTWLFEKPAQTLLRKRYQFALENIAGWEAKHKSLVCFLKEIDPMGTSDEEIFAKIAALGRFKTHLLGARGEADTDGFVKDIDMMFAMSWSMEAERNYFHPERYRDQPRPLQHDWIQMPQVWFGTGWVKMDGITSPCEPAKPLVRSLYTSDSSSFETPALRLRGYRNRVKALAISERGDADEVKNCYIVRSGGDYRIMRGEDLLATFRDWSDSNRDRMEKALFKRNDLVAAGLCKVDRNSRAIITDAQFGR